MAWPTGAEVLNAAARELGLASSDVTDPYASSDTHYLQLTSLLQKLGEELLRDFQWSHLETEYTFSTSNGDNSYDLPAGFFRLVNGTCWNRTQQESLLGPLNAQQWQQLQGSATAELVSQAFRVKGLTLYLYPTPTATETVALEYVSRYWVAESGQSSPNTETADAYTDTLYFDRRLLVAGLKLAFARAKGFDTLALQQDYDAALARAQGGDGAAPVLSVDGGGGGVHLLDWHNIPETGFGA
jgi:hypothetical protein